MAVASVLPASDQSLNCQTRAAKHNRIGYLTQCGTSIKYLAPGEHTGGYVAQDQYALKNLLEVPPGPMEIRTGRQHLGHRPS